jgi:hypothetical protein
MPYKGLVKIVIYDILGREVLRPVNEYKNAGDYKVEFNGTYLASGVYFYMLIVDDKKFDTKKMVLIK